MCFACKTGADRTAVLGHVADLVEQYGVTYIPIDGHGFVYTVGMTGLGMPELWADQRSRAPKATTAPLAADPLQPGERRLHDFLVPVVDWTKAVGSLSEESRMPPGETGYEVAFETVNPAQLNVARAFYADQPVEVRALRAVRVPRD